MILPFTAGVVIGVERKVVTTLYIAVGLSRVAVIDSMLSRSLPNSRRSWESMKSCRGILLSGYVAASAARTAPMNCGP